MAQEMMQYLIASDIFGRTSALEELASELSDSIEIFDPYDSKQMNFNNEREAYRYFVSNVGLDKYSNNLKKITKSFSEPLRLIGFSVGASAIWNFSSQSNLKHISKAYCFYGSQIRNEKNICPIFPIQLIFPDSEKHFSVSKLITDISGKENVQILQTPFSHGFMNRHSENFNQTGYTQFIQTL